VHCAPFLALDKSHTFEIQWKLNTRPFIEAISLTPEELGAKLKESVVIKVIRDASKYWIRVK